MSQAQNTEKIKGNRDVTVKQTYVDPFKGIVVGEDFSVELIYNAAASVEIEADDNLHEVIKFEVATDTLKFWTTKRITSHKTIKITVNYSDPLTYIETIEDGEIRSLTSLELKDVTLKTSGSSKAYLNINANNFTYNGTDKAKVKLNVTAKDSAALILSANCKLDALLNSQQATVDLYQRATATLEGNLENLTLRTDNFADFKGKNLTAVNCNLVSESSSEVYINVSKEVTIDASGSAEIYLYNDPKITINKFTDTAKLQKKNN